MIVKNVLEEYRENKRRLIFLEKELQYINKNTEDIGAVQLKEKIGVTNKVNNNIENKYIRKEIEIESIVNEIKYLKYVIELAEFYISIADTAEEQELLQYRYQNAWKLSRIAKKVNLSESGVRMKVERALKKIDIADTAEEQELLQYRYQNAWKLSRIAKKVNLSESGVRMKVERALKKIDEIVDLNNMKYMKGLGS